MSSLPGSSPRTVVFVMGGMSKILFKLSENVSMEARCAVSVNLERILRVKRGSTVETSL